MRHSQTIGGNLLQRFDEADVSNVFSSLIVCENWNRSAIMHENIFYMILEIDQH